MKPTVAFILAFVAGLVVSFASLRSAPAEAADYNVDSAGGCPVIGADAGSTANITIPSGVQIQVRPETYSGVRYRVCQSASCTATSTDSILDTDKFNDLCVAAGYRTLSLYKLYDGGNPQTCVYLVAPAMPGVCKQ